MAAYSSIGKIPKIKISSLGCLTNVGVHTKHLRQQKSQVVLSTTIVSQAFRMWQCVLADAIYTHTHPPPPPIKLCPVLVSLVFLHMFFCPSMVLHLILCILIFATIRQRPLAQIQDGKVSFPKPFSISIPLQSNRAAEPHCQAQKGRRTILHGGYLGSSISWVAHIQEEARQTATREANLPATKPDRQKFLNFCSAAPGRRLPAIVAPLPACPRTATLRLVLCPSLSRVSPFPFVLICLPSRAMGTKGF